MATNYIAVPHGHTVIHLHLLHCLTHTMQVYNRLIATGHANLIQQAIMGFPITPETSNMKGPTPCKSEVKTENPNRNSSSPKHQRSPPSPESTRRSPPSPEPTRRSHTNKPESIPKPYVNKRVFFIEEAARARKTAYLSANDVNDRAAHHLLRMRTKRERDCGVDSSRDARNLHACHELFTFVRAYGNNQTIDGALVKGITQVFNPAAFMYSFSFAHLRSTHSAGLNARVARYSASFA